jgi:hypothetical protein
MGAQPAASLDHVGDEEILDADTSAAILRWMETATSAACASISRRAKWGVEGCCPIFARSLCNAARSSPTTQRWAVPW